MRFNVENMSFFDIRLWVECKRGWALYNPQTSFSRPRAREGESGACCEQLHAPSRPVARSDAAH